VIRALRRGAKLLYWPGFVQYHYVDLERLTLSYIVRKGYQRTRSTARLRHSGLGVPLFAWRKLLTYLLHIVFALSWQKRRFYLVRCAASLGEIRGMREASKRRRLPLGFEPGVRRLGLTTLAAFVGTGLALSQMRAVPWHTALPPLATAALAALALLAPVSSAWSANCATSSGARPRPRAATSPACSSCCWRRAARPRAPRTSCCSGWRRAPTSAWPSCVRRSRRG